MTFPLVHFMVRGLPVPQGSVRAFMAGGKAHVATKSAPLMAWRTAIATAASSAMGDKPVIDEPLTVWATFYLPRPASTPRRITLPAKKPDIDKLARACLDGISGVCIRDDSLVVRLDASKKFADDLHPPGVSIFISTVDKRDRSKP